ncbi:hypothetical protein G6F16_011908 [Rhizopus arrhizus]|nr:hypothetical protein G6F24_012311 [Rhizopus arrhizus]KAG0781082.1 hypothetical protein G6F21_011830 [Rhizopus arrhizus]KAG0822597.1 hypothetical protein G6F19_011280 [Rhizopus arrhizus]KAG0863294.1 hypothetical protein G6F16_011908 [Rhizopus arrhizus]KAG0891876.1 hypothetical protein G6F34_011333 [Rhizopus arrhizus]
MTRSISQDTQNDLRVLLESDLSYEEIADRLTLSKATVHQYCKKWNIQRPDNTGGRPQILTKTSKSIMKKMIILGRLKSAVEVFDYFKAIYPRIQRPTKKKGTSFVSKTQESTLGMGTCSQSKTNVWGSNGVEFYWSLPGSPLQPHHVVPTVKHGGGSVMVWACMPSHGVGYICEIYDGRMTASDYIHILKTELADTLDYYRLGDGDFIFQHDNDPKHTAKLTTTYLKEEAKYPVLPWPSQLPDLNPIEHMWRHLKLKLALYEQRARGVHEVWE